MSDTLWAVNVRPTDDLLPQASREEAERAVAYLAEIAKIPSFEDWGGEVVEWPYDAETHAATAVPIEEYQP